MVIVTDPGMRSPSSPNLNGFVFDFPAGPAQGITAIEDHALAPEHVTGPHEVGHLLGARHASDNNGAPGGAWAPGRGWAWQDPDIVIPGFGSVPGTVYRTTLGRRIDVDGDGVMDFPTTPTPPLNDFGNRLLRWSNPDVDFSGAPTGRVDYNNVANVNTYAEGIGDIQEGYFCPGEGTGTRVFLNHFFEGIAGGPIAGSDTGEQSLRNRFAAGEWTPADMVHDLYNGTLVGADGTALADFSVNARLLVKVYRAIFDRYPDRGGYLYWLSEMRGGFSPIDLTDFFISSDEFQITYGGTTDDEYVELLYQNLLNRPSDAEGKAYWLGLIANGTLTRGGVFFYLVESGEKANIDLAQGFDGREMFNVLTRLGIGILGSRSESSFTLTKAAAANDYGRDQISQIMVYMQRRRSWAC